MFDLSQLVLFAGIAVLVAAVAAGSVAGGVERSRLERFARRQKLTVTATNGNQIIAYLATTRRWRAAGVVAGIYLPMIPSLGDVVGLQALPIFAGWFAGAVIAEARVAHLAVGARRVASLRQRRPSAYLSRFSWYLLPATAVLSVCVAVGGARWGNADLSIWLWAGVALAVAALVRLTQVRILRRPQPHAEPDVLAGDDAIRSRSLHVLAGGGAALVLYGVSLQLTTLQLDPSQPYDNVVRLVQSASIILIPALGWNVGTWAWRVRREPTGQASVA